MQDKKYREFNAKLIPTVDFDTVIGIRTPDLRKFAGRFSKTSEAAAFLDALPHRYFEENNLHAFLIEQIRDYDEALKRTEEFLPYIDNWATCDTFLPPVFKKNRENLREHIKEWIKSDKAYTVRYAVGLLMRLYLDDAFEREYLEMTAAVDSDEYYVNMMVAWYFATAIAKQYDDTIVYFTEKRLKKQVHNKAIQKSVESRRVADDVKKKLRELKIS